MGVIEPHLHPGADAQPGRGNSAGGAAVAPDLVLAQALSPLQRTAQYDRLAKATLLLLDAFVLWACFFVGRLVMWSGHSEGLFEGVEQWWANQGAVRVQVFALVNVLFIMALGALYGHYTLARRRPWWDETRQLLAVLVMAGALDAALLYLGKWPFSRLWTGTTWMLALFALPTARLLVQRMLRQKGMLTQHYVLLGTVAKAQEAAAALASEPLLGYRPAALICTEDLPAGPVSLAGEKVPTVAFSEDIRRYLMRPGPYQLFIALDSVGNQDVRGLASELMLHRDDILLIPPLNGLPLLGMEVSLFFSHEVVVMRARNNLQRRSPQWIKRTFDVLASLVLLVLACPLMAWVAWRIHREDGGPILYVQDRVGQGGKTFPFIKFRSMVLNADRALDEWRESQPQLYAQYKASNFKLAKDPRVTRIGRFIRRTSLDELPQLINVLRGDMSLVGPRPLLVRELPDYGPAIQTYRVVRPGITGLWQISGRSHSTFEHRIAMDLWYVRNWSLFHDLVILLRTVKVVLKQEGAC